MSAQNITLYTAATPNGFKISIMLEELGLSYHTQPVDLMINEQKEEWFLKFNPNGRLPAITDGSTRVFESGAIMLYLVDKYDTDHKISYKPGNVPGYTEQLSWLMWQMGGLGPMQGQAHHFTGFAPVRSNWGITRYTDETKRLYSVLNTRLNEVPYVAGDKYTIADIACFCWVRVSPALLGFDLDEWPAIKNWHNSILQRETVRTALKVPESKVTEEEFAKFVAEKRRDMEKKANTDYH